MIEDGDPGDEDAPGVVAAVYGARCARCRQLVATADGKTVKAHYATVRDVRPCPGSYKPPATA